MRTLQERIEIFKSSDLYPVVSSEFCNGRSVCSIVAGIAAAGGKDRPDTRKEYFGLCYVGAGKKMQAHY